MFAMKENCSDLVNVCKSKFQRPFMKLQKKEFEWNVYYTLTKSEDRSWLSITTSVSIFDNVTSLLDFDDVVCGVLSDTSYSLLSAVCRLSDFSARMHL